MNLLLWILVSVLAITLVFGYGFVLWMIAEMLSKFFNIIGLFWTIIESLFTLKWNTGRKKLNQYFYDLGLSKDQHAGVMLRDLFTKIMLRKLCIPFGDPDETLSYYFAINKLIHDRSAVSSGVNKFGLFWAKFLDFFERKKGGHLHVAIYNKMLKEEAILRKHGITVSLEIEEYKNQIVKQFEDSL